jgi:hypothetical protein
MKLKDFDLGGRLLTGVGWVSVGLGLTAVSLVVYSFIDASKYRLNSEYNNAKKEINQEYNSKAQELLREADSIRNANLDSIRRAYFPEDFK